MLARCRDGGFVLPDEEGLWAYSRDEAGYGPGRFRRQRELVRRLDLILVGTNVNFPRFFAGLLSSGIKGSSTMISTGPTKTRPEGLSPTFLALFVPPADGSRAGRVMQNFQHIPPFSKLDSLDRAEYWASFAV